MVEQTLTTNHTWDASGEKLGRLATKIAHTLLGKDTTNFARNTIASVLITIENVDALSISDKKKKTKIYDHYSGYPGGRKEITLEELIEKKGFGEALKNAVYNMLPNNRLRKARMKHLIIK